MMSVSDSVLAPAVDRWFWVNIRRQLAFGRERSALIFLSLQVGVMGDISHQSSRKLPAGRMP
jgi:hypothetical protein